MPFHPAYIYKSKNRYLVRGNAFMDWNAFHFGTFTGLVYIKGNLYQFHQVMDIGPLLHVHFMRPKHACPREKGWSSRLLLRCVASIPHHARRHKAQGRHRLGQPIYVHVIRRILRLIRRLRYYPLRNSRLRCRATAPQSPLLDGRDGGRGDAASVAFVQRSQQ